MIRRRQYFDIRIGNVMNYNHIKAPHMLNECYRYYGPKM